MVCQARVGGQATQGALFFLQAGEVNASWMTVRVRHRTNAHVRCRRFSSAESAGSRRSGAQCLF